MSGIYAMYFTGKTGSGHAVIIMKDGIISGADAVGVLLDGTYQEIDKDMLSVSITLTIPAGIWLVSGASPKREPSKQLIQTVLPADFGNGRQIGVQTPAGPINVAFKRLRDVP